MTAAGGDTTLTTVTNVGSYTIYKINNDDWDSTETFDIPSTASQFAAEDQVVILGAVNETTESQAADGSLTVSYDETNKRFTATESGATGDSISIFFMHIK